jgi:hypothetical protein
VDAREPVGVYASWDCLDRAHDEAMLLRHVLPPLLPELVEFVAQEAVASNRTPVGGASKGSNDAETVYLSEQLSVGNKGCLPGPNEDG